MKKLGISVALSLLFSTTVLAPLALWADTASDSSGGSEQAPARRALPQPFDSIFPISEYLGPTIGVPDTSPIYPLNQALWNHWSSLKDNRIKIYGWINPGMNISTSHMSNTPMSYDIVPNTIQLDQAVLRIERQPDTVQTDKMDWGFRWSNLYGMDYRYTTAKGYFSQQLLERNALYGYDPVEAYGQIYVPCVAQGMVVTFGRYISPPDIEAQLSPQNLLYSHSMMFTVDAYTQTGVNSAVKLNDHWTVLAGAHAGNDIAIWDKTATPTGQFMVRWISPSNSDSIWAGIDSINAARFRGTKDNYGEDNVTWTHRFTDKLFTATEAYFLYQWDGVLGGTCNFGPPRNYGGGGGCGAPIPNMSRAWGAVNYTSWKFSSNDFVTVRNDWLDDVEGERTGFDTNYASWTIGLTHYFAPLTLFRPEIRYDHAFQRGVTPFDNGTRRSQSTFNVDFIQWF